MSVSRIMQQAAAGAAGGAGAYADDVFSTYLYEGSSQRTRIRNDVKLGDGPENGTQLHLTGDNLTDSAPVASTITNNNSVAVSTSVKKYGTGSIEFNSGSANQTLQFDQSSDMKFPDGKSDFTVEGWIYMGETGSFRTMFSLGVPFQLYINNNTVTLYIAETISSSYVSGLNPLNGTTNAITTGAWHHVAVVRHGDEFSVYTNGTRTTPVTYSGNVHVGPTGTIGGYTSTQYLFAPGSTSNYIDDFRISDRAVYTDNFTPPSSAHSLDTLVTGEGGLVWIKKRTGVENHVLTDTERGATKTLVSNATSAEATDTSHLTGFTNDGFTLANGNEVNHNNQDFVSWTFRKQPGFFDIVTWTGNGVSGREIPHSLGSVPGMIIVKNLSLGSADWRVFHRSLGPTKNLLLNGTNAALTQTSMWNDTAPTSTVFTVGNDGGVNSNASTYNYVAYIFAHDAQDFGTNSDESIIKCGSFTTDGSGNASVDLGFEPQWVMVKATNQSYSWEIYDVLRGFSTTGHKILKADSSAAELSNTAAGNMQPTSTGFSIGGNYWGANVDLVYMAIRRPHKPASEFAATDLFAVELASNTSAGGKIFTTTFPVDFTIQKQHTVSSNFFVNDRMRDGGNNTAYIQTNTTNAEANFASVTMEFDHMDGVYSTTSFNWSPRIFYALRRAPGFFDVVTYEGNGVNGHQIDHNLGVEPELIIQKVRSIAGSDWHTWAAGPGSQVDSGGITGLALDLNSAGYTTINYGANLNMLNAKPTSSYINVKNVSWDSNGSNASGQDYVVYLFATTPGISKVGTYTGTGSAQTIDCGFSSGARFVMIKQTDVGGGDWRVFDTERGIVSGNDPVMALNSTTQSTAYDNYLSPDSSGFALVGNPSNSSGNTFLFLAIA